MRIQAEVKPLGAPFDGAGIVAGQTFEVPAPGDGLSVMVSELDLDTAYHWRLRAQFDPAQSTPQGWTPWIYGGGPGDGYGVHLRTGCDSAFYGDGDGDGYGDPGEEVRGCAAPDGYVADATDCDDAAGGVNPGATEVCNGTDDDCDEGTDEGVLISV